MSEFEKYLQWRLQDPLRRKLEEVLSKKEHAQLMMEVHRFAEDRLEDITE